MQPVHARSASSGLPLLPLLLAVPVVLAFGFVTGLGLAAYSGKSAATVSPTHQVSANNPAQGGDTGPDLSWMITPTTGNGQTQPPDVGPQPPVTTPPTTVQEPVYFTGPAHDSYEARKALASDYSLYQSDAGTIQFEYERMRQSASGVSIVGIISADSYATWVKALQTDPAKLTAWLSAAAARVQPAAIQDPFHLSWAVVDVLRDRPPGYADAEVTPLDNRTYLVIRPLAATVDHTKTEVAIRPLTSLAQAPQTGVAGATAPWAVYGPVLRFDATDLYQPARALGALPLTASPHQ